MRINKFKKVGTNKYKIYFDDEVLTLYEDVILKYNLLYKKDIDSDLLISINEDNYKSSIYDVALKYISIRMRFEKEIYKYLVNKKFDVSDINEVIQRLKNENMINDEETSKCYINDKINLTKYGPNKILLDLKEYGVDISKIDIDKELITDKLNKIIDKEIKHNMKLPKNKMYFKILNNCINMGYDKSMIEEMLSTKELNSYSSIEDEYKKLYTKYSKKYDDYKLSSTIKSKLYQKGYSTEEINKLF